MGPLLRTIKRALNDNTIIVNPFRHYKNTLVPKDRGYLLKSEIIKLIEYTPCDDFSERMKKLIELVRDLALFSCFTGFSYIDIYQQFCPFARVL